MRYTIEFERIGRNAKNIKKSFDAKNADELAEKIHSFAGQYLASSDYGVELDIEKQIGTIECGRFGSFKIQPSLKLVV